MIRTHRTATAVVLGLLGGCVAVPPAPPRVPPAGATAPFVEAAAVLPGPAWTPFDDPALVPHLQRTLAANTDVRVALGNLQAARASADLAGAARWPATVVESGVGPDRPEDQPSTTTIMKTSYELGATVAWEVDVFARIRSGVTAARADRDAAAAQLEAIRLAAVADTAAAWIDWCAAGAGEALAHQQLAAFERSRALVADRLAAGEASPLELAQADTQAARAAAEPPRFAVEARRALYRLAVLEGLSPAAMQAAALSCVALPDGAAALPAGDATALLARRPDLRAAEHRLAAAAARVGVATADLYPRLQLAGSAGLIRGGFDAILTPLVSWNFPNRLAAHARIAAAEGTRDAALATWDGTLLRALAEVETALADLAAETGRRTALEVSVRQAGLARIRSEARFRHGAENYLSVLDAERTANDAALAALQSGTRLAQARVQLFRALGGGWDTRGSPAGP